MNRKLVFATIGSLLAAVAGCSDDPSPPTDNNGGSGGQGACVKLDLSQTQMYRFSDASFAVQATVSPRLENAYQSLAVLELYNEWSSPNLPPLTTGNFDLGSQPNDKYQTCQHCVTVITPDSSERPTRTFFQTAGEIEITKLHPDDPSVAAGKMTEIQLSEVQQNADGTWTPVTDGACFTIASWSFDTTPVDGIPCEKAEDCGNTMRQICSPKTKTCAPFDCLFTFDLVCPAGEMCVAQVPSENSIGACYKECTPLTSGACDAGSECIAIDPVQKYGVCRPLGEGKIGETCAEPDISTGCEVGSVCAGIPAECQKTCSFLTPNPGCPDGTICSLSNICLAPDSGDPAPIGGDCQQSWVPYRGCGADGEAFRGLCFSLYPEDLVEECHRMCRVEKPDCPAGEYCAGIFSNPNVGTCWKIPVCGDKILDPLNEVCDDGNAVSGDGCSSDCKVAEFDVLCKAAESLPLAVDIQSTTEGASTGYGGSCELYVVVPSKTYSYDVPGPGRLSLELTSNSSANLDLLVVGDCADPNGSELACQSTTDSPEKLNVDFAAKPNSPAMVVVRGNTIPDVGAFTLRASFTPAVCGDGLTVGPEICDDGNTNPNDGFCAADCLSADWPAICSSIPVLSTTAPNMGTTENAPNINNTDGYCTFQTEGETMYRFVAPKDGTLKLRVTEAMANFALYVTDGCGAATEASLLGCSNTGWPPNSAEQLDVALKAGKAVTVVVDTSAPGPAGAFVLQATFE